MATFYLTDENTGELVLINSDPASGVINVTDDDTGELVEINLATYTGILHVRDAKTGNIVTIDYSNPSGILYVNDYNTGEIIEIDLSNPVYSLYVLDHNTGDFVLVTSAASDNTAPTLQIVMSDYSLGVGDTATVTFIFSEEPQGFTAANVTSPNGVISGLGVADDVKVYTATFTPNSGVFDLTNVISVDTSWTDLAGNAPAGATTSDNYTVDTTRPTVAITSTESSPSFANPIPLTFTLSEVSTDFAVGDITVGAGGSIGNFAGSGTAYTADLTITTAGATVTVDVAANAFHDAAGNGNEAATQFSINSGLQLMDKFTTNAAAPLTSPRTCEPGMGSLVITDASNKLSIASSKLTLASGDVANIQTAAGVALAIGTALKFKWIKTSTTGPNFGFLSHVAQVLNTGLTVEGGGIVVDANAVVDERTWLLVLRNPGYIVIDSTNSRIMWVSNKVVTNRKLVWGTLYGFEVVAATLDEVAIGNLGAPWNNQTSPATSYIASPTNGQISTMTANGLVEFTWTPAGGEILDLQVRRTDDDNCWIIRCDQTNSKLYLYEKQGGVETERGATGGVALAFPIGGTVRMSVIAYGNTIRVIDEITGADAGSKIYYTSASFNNSATGVKVSGFASGSNLGCWPSQITPPF